MTIRRHVEGLKVRLLHGDPLGLENCQFCFPFPQKQAFFLLLGTDGGKEAEIVGIPQIGMTGVRTLNQNNGGSFNRDRLSKGHGGAYEGAVGTLPILL